MASVFRTYDDYKEELSGQRPGLTKSYEAAPAAEAQAPQQTVEAPQQAEPTQGQTIQQPQTFSSGVEPRIEEADRMPQQSYVQNDMPKIEVQSYQAPQTTELYQNLFKPVSERLQTGTQRLQETAQQFTQDAGPFRSWDSIGGEQQLSSILGSDYKTPEEEQAGIAKGKELLSASYTGPTQLDQGQMQEIQGLTNQLQAESPYYGRPTGFGELIRQYRPGLTPGEVRFNIQTLQKEPEYEQAYTGYQQAIENLAGQVGQASEQAQDIVEQRQAGEAGIAEQAQQYLTGRESAIEQALAAEIARLEQEEAAKQAAWQRFQETGSLDDLLAVEELTGPTPMPEHRQEIRREALRQGIMNRPEYEMIASIPEMLRNEGVGTEFKFDPDWWLMHQGDYSPEQWTRIKELARQRQRELEGIEDIIQQPMTAESFYTPGQQLSDEAAEVYQSIIEKYPEIASIAPLHNTITSQGKTYDAVQIQDADGNWHSVDIRDFNAPQDVKSMLQERQAELYKAGFGDVVNPWSYGQEVGKYRDVMPIYNVPFDWVASPEEYRYQAPDIRPFTDMVPGISPSRENVSTEEQRKVFNRINELLDESEKLVEVEPFRAAQLITDVDSYLAQEEETLRNRKEELDEAQKNWLNTVSRARRKYRKSRKGIMGALKKNGLGWLPEVMGRVASGIMTGGLSELIGLGGKELGLEKEAGYLNTALTGGIAGGALSAMDPIMLGAIAGTDKRLTDAIVSGATGLERKQKYSNPYIGNTSST